METEISRLENPIDVMYLIHKAFRAEAARVEEMVREYECGSSLQAIRAAFNSWAASLIFHAQQEDEFMTTPLPDFQPARDNEAEHAELGDIIGALNHFLDLRDHKSLSERVKAAIVVLHEEQHTNLLEKLEDVMEVLNQEIGKSRVIDRTKRHLFGRIVALQIAQDDHLESEEAFILPEIYQRFDETAQLEMVSHLLVDHEAEDPLWVIDWMAEHLTPGEKSLLGRLTTRFPQPVLLER